MIAEHTRSLEATERMLAETKESLRDASGRMTDAVRRATWLEDQNNQLREHQVKLRAALEGYVTRENEATGDDDEEEEYEEDVDENEDGNDDIWEPSRIPEFVPMEVELPRNPWTHQIGTPDGDAPKAVAAVKDELPMQAPPPTRPNVGDEAPPPATLDPAALATLNAIAASSNAVALTVIDLVKEQKAKRLVKEEQDEKKLADAKSLKETVTGCLTCMM